MSDNEKYPHEITIIRHETVKHEDKYSVLYEENVLWYGSEGIQVKDGYIKNDSINILIPRITANIKKKDIVILGHHEDITNPREAKNYDDVITVTSVNKYDVGSSLDCILVGGE